MNPQTSSPTFVPSFVKTRESFLPGSRPGDNDSRGEFLRVADFILQSDQMYKTFDYSTFVGLTRSCCGGRGIEPERLKSYVYSWAKERMLEGQLEMVVGPYDAPVYRRVYGKRAR